MTAILANLRQKVDKIYGGMSRKKLLDSNGMLDTPLDRCLSTMDLTLLGVGQMVGAGLYVLTGTVVRNIAGPGVIFSYLLAGISAAFSSLCYAEFGSRVPKAGSAYSYTYVTIGELCAFVIGWNIILEYWLGAASVAKAWSAAFDAMFNGAVKNATISAFGTFDQPYVSNYVDVLALLIVLVGTIFIAWGTKISVSVNNVFTVINMSVIAIIILAGLSMGNVDNWTNVQHGGFLPFGVTGVFAGAATCFYAFIGFEGIATAGEEAKRPDKSIPAATGLAVAIATALYFGSSVSLTLLVPYYKVDIGAPFPAAFASRGLNWAKVLIAFGSLFGISSSLLGSLFALPRGIYAMASDGLLFRCLATVNCRTQTPLLAIVVSGVGTAVFATTLELDVLVEFLSLGTLMSFTIVAACILVLRYQPVNSCPFELAPDRSGSTVAAGSDVEILQDPDTTSTITAGDVNQLDIKDEEKCERKESIASTIKHSQSYQDIGKIKQRFANIPYLNNITPGKGTSCAVLVMSLGMVLFSTMLLRVNDNLAKGDWWAVILIIISIFLVGLPFFVLCAHHTNKMFLTFQVPWVPLVPSISMFMNISMMVKLNHLTWIRLAVWMTLGMIIYLCYGFWNSTENKPLSAYSHVISYAGGAAVPDSKTVSGSRKVSSRRPDYDTDDE